MSLRDLPFGATAVGAHVDKTAGGNDKLVRDVLVNVTNERKAAPRSVFTVGFAVPSLDVDGALADSLEIIPLWSERMAVQTEILSVTLSMVRGGPIGDEFRLVVWKSESPHDFVQAMNANPKIPGGIGTAYRVAVVGRSARLSAKFTTGLVLRAGIVRPVIAAGEYLTVGLDTRDQPSHNATFEMVSLVIRYSREHVT